jgi:hypothetical protein
MLCQPTGFGKQEIVAALQEDHPDEDTAHFGTLGVEKPASAPSVVGRIS